MKLIKDEKKVKILAIRSALTVCLFGLIFTVADYSTYSLTSVGILWSIILTVAILVYNDKVKNIYIKDVEVKEDKINIEDFTVDLKDINLSLSTMTEKLLEIHLISLPKRWPIRIELNCFTDESVKSLRNRIFHNQEEQLISTSFHSDSNS